MVAAGLVPAPIDGCAAARDRGVWPRPRPCAGGGTCSLARPPCARPESPDIFPCLAGGSGFEWPVVCPPGGCPPAPGGGGGRAPGRHRRPRGRRGAGAGRFCGVAAEWCVAGGLSGPGGRTGAPGAFVSAGGPDGPLGRPLGRAGVLGLSSEVAVVGAGPLAGARLAAETTRRGPGPCGSVGFCRRSGSGPPVVPARSPLWRVAFPRPRTGAASRRKSPGARPGPFGFQRSEPPLAGPD